jgi:hypothetical protein
MISASRMNRQSLERVHELTGKLVDERIRDAEWWELHALLTNSDEGLTAYIEATLLHANLYCLGNESRQEQWQ